MVVPFLHPEDARLTVGNHGLGQGFRLQQVKKLVRSPLVNQQLTFPATLCQK